MWRQALRGEFSIERVVLWRHMELISIAMRINVICDDNKQNSLRLLTQTRRLGSKAELGRPLKRGSFTLCVRSSLDRSRTSLSFQSFRRKSTALGVSAGSVDAP